MCSRSIIQCILLASLIPLSMVQSSAAHAEYKLHLLESSPASVYQRTSDALVQALLRNAPDTSIARQILPTDNTSDTVLFRDQADWQIAIGSRACEALIRSNTETPTLCAFITAAAFSNLRTKYPTRKRIHGLCIDQPLPRLIKLASLLHPQQEKHQVGLLSTDSDPEHLPKKQIANTELQLTQLSVSDNPIKRLKPLISDNDSIIVLPGNSHLNRLAARLVLQLSLKHKTPVIGFSQKYTNAGALLSIHPSPEDIASDLARILTSKPVSSSLPELQPGDSFSLSINPNVARKLRYQIDTESLKQHLNALNSDS
jgi:ABC-type uncharacterized transport system substrate-binding protein